MRKTIRKLSLVIVLAILGLPILLAQVKKEPLRITNVVLSLKGEAVAGASIFNESGRMVGKTDSLGTFDIEAYPEEFLRIEASGYEELILSVKSIQGMTRIEMGELPFQMMEQDKIFIPFGNSTKRQQVGSIYTLDASDMLEYDINMDVLTALQGRVPGLFGINNLRGLKDPLIVIDGINQSAEGISSEEILRNLTMMEVDQISILKDAVSSVLYGAQADRGVIQITTKRGTPNRVSRKINAEFGVKQPVSYPSYLDAGEYMQLFNEALSNDGLDPMFAEDEILNTINGTDPVKYPDEDYYNSTYLKDLSTFYAFRAEASGGNNSVGYYSNLGWEHEGSLYKVGSAADAHSDKINFRGNVDYTITPWLKARLDGIGILGISSVPNGDPSNNWKGDFWQSTTQLFPNYFPVLIPSSSVTDPNILESAVFVNGDHILGGTNQFRNNQYGNFTLAGFQKNRELLLATNMGFDFDLENLLKGLSAKILLSYQASSNYTLRQDNSYAVYEPTFVPSYSGQEDSLVLVKYGNDVKVDNQSIQNPDALRKLGFYGFIDYTRELGGKHLLNLMGVSYMDQNNLMNNIYTQKSQHVGFRAHYMFRNKIMAEFSTAYVGSGKLSSGNRYELAPTFGAAWVLSEEGFFSGVNIVNYLKIKASYGSLVTDRYLGYYYYQDSYMQGSRFYYNQTSGNNNVVKYLSVSANPEISMSRRNKINVGLETSFFTNRLWIEANYFSSKMTGFPVAPYYTYPVQLGGTYPFENFEEYQENGFDLGIVFRENLGKFHVDLASNLTHVVPKALLVDEPDNPEAPGRKREGKSTDAIFGYVAEGLFTDQGDIENHVQQSFGVVRPGDIKYSDINKDGFVDENDQIQIGNSDPRYQVDLSINLKYGRWNLYLLATSQLGGDRIFDDPYYWVYGNGRKYSENVTGRWTSQNAENATYPRLTSGNGSNNFRNSTYWIQDNNWIRIHTAQFSYTINDGLAFMNRFQVFLRANNLFTISKISKELDLNIGSMPRMRNFSVGLVIGL